LGLLFVSPMVALGAGTAGALPRDPDKGGPLEQAGEESAVKDRPPSRLELPAGELRLSASEVLAASNGKVEFSVSLDRAVEEGSLELTLPKLWLHAPE